jgi:hypothetical protein
MSGELAVHMEMIERRIYVIRGQKVMLDSDLADLYEVETKALNRAVRRNPERFPADFMFQLTSEEAESLRCQFGASNEGRGGRRYLPYVFSEHGIAMLSSVLNSPRAVQMNILIVRAFIRMREMISTHHDLAHKIADLERRQQEQGLQIDAVFDAVRQLIAEPEPPKRSFGFRSEATAAAG